MEEMSDNARVWRVYNDEADRIDAEMVDGWRSTLDTLLIFAGLFSAVVATFVTQTSQDLRPDYSEVTASLLTELVGIQRTAATNGNLSAVNPSSMTRDSLFTPERRDVVLNGLWFVSLGLTLMTALVTGLVKQWLHYYLADASGSAKERACIRQFRSMGLAAWGVSPIIELLPVLMNVSLLLFFAGLILFCQRLSGTEGITAITIALTCISFVFYLGSSILSVLYPQCPYKSSLSSMFNFYFRILRYLFVLMFIYPRRLPAYVKMALTEGEDLSGRDRRRYNLSPMESVIKILHKLSSIRHAESTAISQQHLPLQFQAITSMVINSSNSTVPDIALQALAGLHKYTFSGSSLPILLWFHISETLWNWLPTKSNPNRNYQLPVAPSVVERYSRALLCRSYPVNERTQSVLEFAARSDPEDLRYLGLHALLNLQAEPWDSDGVGQNLDALIQHVHQLPPIEIHDVHPWIRTKLRQAMLLGPRAHQDDASISHLAQSLTLLKFPTLQEDLMLYRLELTHSPSGFFDGEEEIQVQTGTRAGQVILPKGLGHTGFIFILPSLAHVALSTGAAEHDSILSLMDEMFTTAKMDTRHPSWKLSPWDARPPNRPRKSVRTAPFRPVLERLLDILIATENPDCSRLWKGSTSLHQRVIMRLHNTIYGDSQYHRPTLDAIFSWLLRLSTHERSDGELPLIEGIDQEVESGLNSFFFGQFSKQGDYSLVELCDYLASHRILGLTKTMLEHLVEMVYPPWRGSPTNWIERATLTGLDRLFRYFVQRNPSNVDQRLPSTEEEQLNTVGTIVGLACKGKPATQSHDSYSPWNTMMTSWLASLREASSNRTPDHLEAATIEQNKNRSQPTRPGLDFATLIRLVEQAIESSPNEQTSVSDSRRKEKNLNSS